MTLCAKETSVQRQGRQEKRRHSDTQLDDYDDTDDDNDDDGY